MGTQLQAHPMCSTITADKNGTGRACGVIVVAMLLLFPPAATRAQPAPEYVHIDFSGFPEGTEISDQYSAYGVTFSLADGPGFPIVAQEGDPMLAFLGGGGSDSPMWAAPFGLTDPVGENADVTAFRPIRIDFDPPARSIRLWLRRPGGFGGQSFRFRVYHSDGQVFTHGGCGSTNNRRYPAGPGTFYPNITPISHVVFECPSCVEPTLGFALCELTLIREPQEPLAAPFIRVGQESSPGAADFDNQVVGVLRPSSSPVGVAPKVGDFYFYGNHYNAESFGGMMSVDPAQPMSGVPGQSSLVFLDAAEGLSLAVIHDRTEAGPANGCLSDPPTDDIGGHAEMYLKFAGIIGTLSDTVLDGESDDAFVLSEEDLSFTAMNNWDYLDTDGFAISGLDGDWNCLVEFTELEDAGTPAISGLTSWVALTTDGTPIELALAADRRVQFTKINQCIAVSSPVDVASCSGGLVTIAANAVTTDSGGAIAYEWRKDGAPLTDGPTGHGSTILGTMTENLQIVDFSPSDVGNFDVVASNLCGSVTSAAAALTFFTGLVGDVNGDGAINGIDIRYFADVIVSGDHEVPAYCAADMNTNGVVDVEDIPYLVAALVQ